jgi:CDP-glycerol glycerophosphotransferase (TagB/SpsB family)
MSDSRLVLEPRSTARTRDTVRRRGFVHFMLDKLRRLTTSFPPRRIRILVTGFLDAIARKRPRTITFVCKRRFGYSGNIRVLCEAMASDSRYSIQLWCEAPLSAALRRTLKQQGIRRLTWGWPRDLWSLVSSGIVVVDHSIRDAYIVRARPDRAIINVWHGVPIKRIELDIPRLEPVRKRIIEDTARLYDAVIANSADDRRAIAQAFGIDPVRVGVTGLPRLDMLTGHHPLAGDLARDRHELRQRLDGRALVLYAPTFRERGPSPLAQLTPGDWAALDATVRAHGAVLGLRPHPYDRTPHPRGLAGVISVSAEQYAETNLVLREARVLVTDFSSIWVDYLVLNRPILGFAKDRIQYTRRERGFTYDLDEVFPTPFAETVDQLLESLREVLGSGSPTPHYGKQRAMFHDRRPPPYAQNCVDLIDRVSRVKHQGKERHLSGTPAARSGRATSSASSS